MKFCVLGTGSKGNCTYLEVNNKKILIDVGFTAINIDKKLKEININSTDIDYIFITHTHSDHVGGLKVFCKKNKCRVYLLEESFSEIDYLTDYNFLNVHNIIDDITIEVFKLSHDFPCAGFKFSFGGKSLVYVTDTGYLNNKYLERLKGANAYVFESNHDIQLLMDSCKYPYHTKQRIRGDVGHLSNEDSAKYLCKLIDENTKEVILAHISENNNTYDLAYEVLKSKLLSKNIEFNNIKISTQNEVMEIVSL